MVKQYQEACMDVGRESGTAVVDSWQCIDSGKEWYVDGVHLSGQGNGELFRSVYSAIVGHWPELEAEGMASFYPWWSDERLIQKLEEQ